MVSLVFRTNLLIFTSLKRHKAAEPHPLLVASRILLLSALLHCITLFMFGVLKVLHL